MVESRSRPAMSVIVFSYNAEETIYAAVDSLIKQDSREPYEVIVVTSGADRSEEIVRGSFPNIKIISSKRRMLPGEARNTGVFEALGEFTAFLEGHGRAAPGWVAHRLESHRRGNSVVAGAIEYGGVDSVIGLASHYVLYANRLPGRPPGIVSFPDSAAHSVSFRRDVYDRAGPFDPSIRIGEDTQFAMRLKELNVTICFEPRVLTRISRPTGLKDALVDHYRRGVRASVARGIMWPKANAAQLILRSGSAWMAGVFRRIRWIRHYAGEPIVRQFLLFPFLLAATLAGRYGWLVQQLRMRRSVRAMR